MTDQAKEEHQRTIQQNKCLHQYFQQLSESLNDAGYSVQETYTLPVQHTPENIKVNLGHRFMAALFPHKAREDGTFHTSDLSTTEIQTLYENINNAMGSGFGVSLDWPDRFNGGKC